MKSFLELISTNRILWINGLLSLLFIAVIIPYATSDIEILDLRENGYDHAEVMAAMEAYGADGRIQYIWSTLTLDTLFPLSFCSLCAGLIYRFTPILKQLAYLPLIALLIDYGENIQIITMLSQFPNIGTAQAEWASLTTQTKFIIGPTSIFLALAASVWTAIMVIYRRTPNERKTR